ncbi:DUF4228 domain-containing protein [Salix suchowensis]|nr:DUF4228 domain-containing protein [Salix suchowensis]
MGNYISCTLSTPLIKNSKAARVVFPNGDVRQFREPVKAAELMLECPNFFLTNSQALHIGRRFSALGADEDLEFGNVYLMFPMKRVSSTVSAADMAVFFMAANSAAKRISGGNNKTRVLPESVVIRTLEKSKGSEVGAPRLSGRGEGFRCPEYMYRLSSCRSRSLS